MKRFNVFCGILRIGGLFLVSFSLSVATSFAQEKLPYSAEKLIKGYKSYEKEISEKAAKLIDDRRLETIKKLEAESAKQAKAGNSSAARAVLEIASALTEGTDVEAFPAEPSGSSPDSRWTSLFQPQSLPDSWIIPKDPDGGWEYSEGALQMKSVFDDATILHDAPKGDLVVRLKMKLEENGNKETKNKDKTAGIGFINSRESLVLAHVNSSGNISGYTTFGEDSNLGSKRSSACQGKFSDVQMAWVGTYFLVFAREKLLIKSDLMVSRNTAKISLLADNSLASFSGVEYLKPTLEDLKRLASGKPIK